MEEEVPDPPNIFDEQAFAQWREEAPDGYLWDDYEHVDRMRLLRDQLVEETSLSGREAEVVVLLSDGYDYEDIAHQLDISRSTASEYAYRAREKVKEAARTLRILESVDEDWLSETLTDTDT